MIRDINIVIAGVAGDGVLFTGNVLAKLLKRLGWEVATSRDFPSNIRGEATNYEVRAVRGYSAGRGDVIDLLLAFDCQAIFRHIDHMAKGGIILCDGEETDLLSEAQREGKTFHRLLLRKMARENFGREIYKNVIALGGLSHILDLDLEILKQVIEATFLESKGRETVEANIRAASIGLKKAQEIVAEEECHPLARDEDGGRLLLSGDEAIALGALASGCRFFAAYPICPASEIWQWLVKYIGDFNGIVVQTEDELAALNMALGASFAGARAMTSTSGPGASLMMEAFSLAGMAEIPVVVAHVQRLGPATGIPTKTQQAELTQWIFGSHGEFPRIVLSPGTIEECFDFTIKAFNLAEIYQCPVVLLTEEEMGQNLRSSRPFDLSGVRIDRGKLVPAEKMAGIQDFRRYEFTPDGISPRSLPGMINGVHLVEGNEHDEYGYRSEDPEVRVRMMNKRMNKLPEPPADLVPSRIWGEERSRTGLISCGSTLGTILEAMRRLEGRGIPAKLLQLRTLWPFPAGEVRAFLESCENVFVIENNFSGELRLLIRSQVEPGCRLNAVLNYSTQTFKPQEILESLERGL